MRWWILAGLAAVCIVAGMMIYVPPLEMQETLVEAGPTAEPMSNVTMADREINLSFSSPLGDLDAPEEIEPGEPTEIALVFDPQLARGTADLYPSENGVAVLIDIAAGKWNEATAAAIDRPELVLAEDAGDVAQTLRLETGILALGKDSPSFVRLYSEEGEELLDLTVEGLSADLSLMPMANPDCAYAAKIGSSTLFDTLEGEAKGVPAPGRPVQLDRSAGTLLMERGGDYVVRALAGGAETTYRLVY